MKLVNRWKLDDEPTIKNKNKKTNKKDKEFKVGDKKVVKKDGKLIKK